LYLARKKYAGQASIQAMLDQVSADLAALNVSGAEALLNQSSPPGDYNGDGIVNMSDYNFWRAAFGSSTIIYGSGADGNYDGVVNGADYIVWRNSFGAGGSGTGLATAIPEPTSGILVGLAIGS